MEAHMKRIGLVLLVALGLTGCNLKLKKHVADIHDVAIKVRHQQVQPSVTLGELDDGDAEGEGEAPRDSGADLAIQAFEQGFTLRLSSLLDTQKMAKKVGKATRSSLKKASPIPLDQRSDWNVELMITEWGVGSGFSGAAQAQMRVHAAFFSPAGERIWKKSIGCSWDLAPSISWNTVQVATNLATLTSMQDGPLREAYMNLAGSCGRALANEFREDVRKAQAKVAAK
jgi:hypothetical protein